MPTYTGSGGRPPQREASRRGWRHSEAYFRGRAARVRTHQAPFDLEFPLASTPFSQLTPPRRVISRERARRFCEISVAPRARAFCLGTARVFCLDYAVRVRAERVCVAWDRVAAKARGGDDDELLGRVMLGKLLDCWVWERRSFWWVLAWLTVLGCYYL